MRGTRMVTNDVRTTRDRKVMNLRTSLGLVAIVFGSLSNFHAQSNPGIDALIRDGFKEMSVSKLRIQLERLQCFPR